MAASLAVGDPSCPVSILGTKLSIEAEDRLFIARERTAQAIILVLVLIVKHIHIDLTRQTPRTSIVQLAFSTLSHVCSSPFPWIVFLIPMVYIGEKANPSRKWPEA